MDQSFIIKAERAIAQHCPELFRQAKSEADHTASLARFGHRLASALPQLLAALCDDIAFQVEATAPRSGDADTVLDGNALSFSHLVLSVDGRSDDIVISVDRRLILSLLDRAFGGDGIVSGPVPDTLPLSAQSILSRVERAFSDAISRNMPGGHLPALRHGRRETDLALLRPFAPEGTVHALPFSIACDHGEAWIVQITMRQGIVEFLGEGDDASLSSQRKQWTAHDAPFSDIPLKLEATLIDMRLPLSRLSGLRPGDLIPVSVARSVPLTLGGKTIAHGSVGEIDDRVAIQITRAF